MKQIPIWFWRDFYFQFEVKLLAFHRPPKVRILLRILRLQVQRSIKQSSDFYLVLVVVTVSRFICSHISKYIYSFAFQWQMNDEWNVDIYDIHLRLDLFFRDFFFFVFVRFPSSPIFQFNQINVQGCKRHSLPLKKDNDYYDFMLKAENTVKLKWLNDGNKNYEEVVRCQYFYDVPFFVVFVFQPIFHEALQWNIFGNLFL